MSNSDTEESLEWCPEFSANSGRLESSDSDLSDGEIEELQRNWNHHKKFTEFAKFTYFVKITEFLQFTSSSNLPISSIL